MSSNFHFNDLLRADHTRVGAHRGTYYEYLEDYEDAAAISMHQGREGAEEHTPKLMEYIADERNIRIAADHVLDKGGAPGPDGRDYAELANSEMWEMARTLKKCLLSGEYQHGRTRRVRIEKGKGRGYRTIDIANHVDRIVSRAVLQIVQPLIDPQFHPNSYGRPRRDRRHALYAALQQIEKGQRNLVVADLKNAFDHVPITRCLDIVKKMLPGVDDSVIQLMGE